MGKVPTRVRVSCGFNQNHTAHIKPFSPRLSPHSRPTIARHCTPPSALHRSKLPPVLTAHPRLSGTRTFRRRCLPTRFLTVALRPPRPVALALRHKRWLPPPSALRLRLRLAETKSLSVGILFSKIENCWASRDLVAVHRPLPGRDLTLPIFRDRLAKLKSELRVCQKRHTCG
jgi:hypothetical protein